MRPYIYQEEIAEQAYDILGKYGLVYLAMEERTGKSLTAIRVAEMSNRKRVLILTKKKALDGWKETLTAYSGDGMTHFTLRNYHAVHKARKLKSGKLKYDLTIDPKDYDLIILDESHSYLSAYPKPGVIWKSVKKLTKGLPILYLSATPHAQGYQLLYNQLALSNWSPFRKYKNFYEWFREYGIANKVRTPYGLVETYTKCKDQAGFDAKYLFITYTRADLNFTHEPEDVLHYFELAKDTKALYNSCMTTEMFDFDNLVYPLDSSMKLRTTLHQIEGGVAKDDMERYWVLRNDEKVQAILDDFGDDENNVIMYHYKAELMKLGVVFEKTRLQATSFAEGVDLSMYDNLIIYSQDFSTARHSQRRARQANKNRKYPIRVHFYLVKDAISEQVYQTVSVNKTNFIDSVFERRTI